MEFKGISFKFVHNPKNHVNKKLEFFIQVRITLERKTKYFTISELPKIPLKYWSGRENRWVKESFSQGARINSYLISKVAALNEFLVLSKTTGKIVTFDLIRSRFFMKGEIETLNDYYRSFIKKHSFESSRTRQAYQTTLSNLDEFNPSVSFNSISESLINEFITWEREKKKIKDVTIDKHLTHIKTVIKFLTQEGFLMVNPIQHSRFKVKPEKAERVSLTEQELKVIGNLVFNEEKSHLIKTRDIFLFLCKTGLYYNDLKSLTKGEIISVEGKKLIQSKRTKNGENYIVPLSPIALEILETWKDTKDRSKKSLLFEGLIAEPVFNRHLKEIAKIGKIDKKLSNKVGRHTFTEIAISNGVPKTFVSKMLGHTKGDTTNHYYDLNPTHFIKKFINNSVFDQ